MCSCGVFLVKLLISRRFLFSYVLILENYVLTVRKKKACGMREITTKYLLLFLLLPLFHVVHISLKDLGSAANRFTSSLTSSSSSAFNRHFSAYPRRPVYQKTLNSKSIHTYVFHFFNLSILESSSMLKNTYMILALFL